MIELPTDEKCRADFEISTLFGNMPGVSMKPGCIMRADDGTFVDPATEQTFQIWKRGFISMHHNIRKDMEEKIFKIVQLGRMDSNELTPRQQKMVVYVHRLRTLENNLPRLADGSRSPERVELGHALDDLISHMIESDDKLTDFEKAFKRVSGK